MKVAIFSTKSYERSFFNRFNLEGKHQLVFFNSQLNSSTTNLAIGFEAVSVLLGDRIDKDTIGKLATIGIKLICLRSTGFDNVDIAAATAQI